jgi:hypothetical protein
MSKQKITTEVQEDKRLNYIFNYVSNRTELDIKRNTRKREYVEARFLFFALASKNTFYSYAKIGSFLGKDHATVIHALKVFNDTLYHTNEYIKNLYDSFNIEGYKFFTRTKPTDEEILYLRAEVDKLVKENDNLRFELNSEKQKKSEFQRLAKLFDGLNAFQYEQVYNKIDIMTKVMRKQRFQELISE